MNQPSATTGLWVGLGLGGPMVAYGIVGAIHDSADTHPAELARWIIGAALVHDLLFAPAILAALWLTKRLAGGRLPAPITWALATSTVLVLFAWPLARGYGEDPRVPSLLPRNYTVGLVAYLAAVWTAALTWLTRRPVRSRDHGNSNGR